MNYQTTTPQGITLKKTLIMKITAVSPSARSIYRYDTETKRFEATQKQKDGAELVVLVKDDVQAETREDLYNVLSVEEVVKLSEIWKANR